MDCCARVSQTARDPIAPRGSQIRVTTSGPEAQALADALEALVGDYFGEGM